MRTLKNRTDDSQSDIVLAIRKLGGDWIPCSGDPKIGFDGLILWRGKSLICEIKNGALSPSQRKLTDREAKRKAQCEARGVPYLVIESVDQAVETLQSLG